MSERIHEMKFVLLRAGLGALLLAAVSCADEEPSGPPENAADAIASYAAIVHASYEDALTRARALDAAVTAFAADPSDAKLAAAKTAWLAAREPYLETEVFRFYDGPIDHPEDGPEGLLNAWPLDEAYIDYVEGDASAGIVNDPSVEISAPKLAELNEQGGEENIATGYHAVEFLLWGQDRDASGPGARPASDFSTGANADRRRQYLTTVSALIVEHLEGLTAAWAPGATNYRSGLVAAAPEEGLRRILTGMIILSGFETGGERLQTALDSGDQEDEHSCFSDNTHRDMIQDVVGIQNVYLGRKTRLDGAVVSGVGIEDVAAAVDAALASRLEAEIADALAKANAIVPPFDREIASDNAAGRARVQALVTSLRTVERSLEELFRALGLSVPAAPQ